MITQEVEEYINALEAHVDILVTACIMVFDNDKMAELGDLPGQVR